MKVRYTPSALKNLDDLGAYIARSNPRAAERTFHKIRSTIESLSFFPLMGHTGHVQGTLEFPVPGLPHIVVYRITEDEMHILNIFHGAQER